jgi:predicted Zn-dependent peptidase
MAIRKSTEYYLGDLLSDAMGKDSSSILNITLKKELELVSEINAFITGSMDEGLFIISGKLSENTSFETLDEMLWKQIELIKKNGFGDNKLNALKNKISTAKAFQDQGLLNRSMNLCFFELLGDANGINEEESIYQSIEHEELLYFAQQTLVKTNCSLLKVHQNAG